MIGNDQMESDVRLFGTPQKPIGFFFWGGGDFEIDTFRQHRLGQI